MNIAKGLVVNHVNATRFIQYLGNNQEISLDLSESQNQVLSGNWFHYVLKNLAHCKEWILALKNFYSQTVPEKIMDIFEQKDEKGNTVFMTAIHFGHLKTALSLAIAGSEINTLNNEGKTWVTMVDNQIHTQMSKRKVIYYQKFIRRILSVKAIEDFSQPVISELIALNNKITHLLYEFKKSSVRYEQYWNDVLIHASEINQVLNAFFHSWKLMITLPKHDIEEVIYKI
jgi:hypothetical protein